MTWSPRLLSYGNALVDCVCHSTDGKLEEFGLRKGGGRSVDLEEFHRMYEACGPAHVMSGGSACNTVASFVGLGGRGEFIGKVADDDFGELFENDLKSVGVAFNTPKVSGPDLHTGRVMVHVTPDGERSFGAHLGVGRDLHHADINPEDIGMADVMFFDGYLLDRPEKHWVVMSICEAAHSLDKTVPIATSLGSVSCARENAETFKFLHDNMVEILFGNQDEFAAYTGIDDIQEMTEHLQKRGSLSVITLGSKGALATGPLIGGREIFVKADRVDQVVDTTGAGDAFAAGFIFGMMQEYGVSDCLKLGNSSAQQVVQVEGARLLKQEKSPSQKLSEYFDRQLSRTPKTLQ